MQTKERFKALVFVISLLTIGLVGNFHPLSLYEADAHPHTVIQSTVTWTRWEWYWTIYTSITGRDRKGHTVTGTNIRPQFVHVTYTTYYADDGHSVHQETVRTEGKITNGIDWNVWGGCGRYECAQYVSN